MDRWSLRGACLAVALLVAAPLGGCVEAPATGATASGSTTGSGGDGGGATDGGGGEGGSGGGDAGAGGGGHGGDGGGGSVPGDPEHVPTTEGFVKGHPHGEVWNWRGIPYAAPPVGDLRFRAPRRPAEHAGVLDAVAFGDVCAQPGYTPGTFAAGDCLDTAAECPEPPASEDCLTLNVWSRDVDAKKPVMVWIHGGGLVVGGSATPLYLGNHLAHGRGDDVVVVTINYRLGVLGFLAHDGLVGEDAAHDPSAGNYGVLDMVRALAWVQDNIAAFGGDPDNVTIFGESGGGLAVWALLATPLSDGLFHKAIVESGVYPDRFSQYDLPTATALGAGFADHVGCPGAAAAQVACLRAADAQALADAGPDVVGIFRTPNMFSLVVDGYAFDGTVSEMIRDQHPKPGLPVLVGTNNDEGWLLGGAMALDDPLLDYDAWLDERFGPAKHAGVAALYDPAWYPWLTVFVAPRFRAIAEIASDWGFYRSAEHFVEQRAFSQGERVYVYHFEYPAGPPLLGPGAPHGFEIAYVFDTNGRAPTGNEPALIDAMQGYWKRFAATGNPNGSGLPTWAPIDATARGYVAFRDLAAPAVPTNAWLGFGDLGPWRPDGKTKLDLVRAWDALIEEDYTPPIVPW